MRRLAFTVVPLLLLACDQQPAAPDLAQTPSLAATAEWLRYSEVWDPWTETVPCRGTDFSIWGEVAIRWHLVNSAGGRFQFQLQFIPNETQVFMEELSTGTVFELQPGSLEVIHLGDGYDRGGTWWLRNRWTFEAPNGDKIIREWLAHTVWNANGDLVVLRDAGEYTCKFANGG